LNKRQFSVSDAIFLNVIEPTTTNNKYMCDLKLKK